MNYDTNVLWYRRIMIQCIMFKIEPVIYRLITYPYSVSQIKWYPTHALESISFTQQRQQLKRIASQLSYCLFLRHSVLSFIYLHLMGTIQKSRNTCFFNRLSFYLGINNSFNFFWTKRKLSKAFSSPFLDVSQTKHGRIIAVFLQQDFDVVNHVRTHPHIKANHWYSNNLNHQSDFVISTDSYLQSYLFLV